MTMNNAASSVQVIRSAGGALPVVLDSGFKAQEVLAALGDAVESHPADPEPLAPDPLRRSSRPYAGEFLG
ncbi:MAG TPA: hypothetical protein VF165_16520 [Nocardioidaceae bacterium]